MISNPPLWLQKIADRQVLREFNPKNERVQNLVRAVFDRIIHFIADCFSKDYKRYYQEQRNLSNPDAISSTKIPTFSVISATSFEELFQSPITYETLKNPVICLGDGNIYEMGEVEAMPQSIKTSAHTGVCLDDVRCYPDRITQRIINDPEHKIPHCPLTNAPFKEPFYCVEDGQTYERAAILEWAKSCKRHRTIYQSDNPVNAFYEISLPPSSVTKPKYSASVQQLTLCPHITMFKVIGKDLPHLNESRVVVRIRENDIEIAPLRTGV